MFTLRRTAYPAFIIGAGYVLRRFLVAEVSMKKISKELDTSCRALCAAMLMANALIYMGAGALYARISGEDFYYHVPFAFLIHGLIVTTIASGVWVVFFRFGKCGFWARYLPALAVSLALFGLSLLVSAVNTQPGYLLWIGSGLFSVLAFGSSVAGLSEKEFKATGERVLWIRSVVNMDTQQ